jgi:hypothetical protein
MSNQQEVRQEVVDALLRVYRSRDKTAWQMAQLRLEFTPPPTDTEVEAAHEQLRQELAAGALRRFSEEQGRHDDDL